MIWLTIFCIGAIVFFNRYLFLAPNLPIKLSPKIKKLLTFSVPAILMSICGPLIFLDERQFRPFPDNPYFIAGLCAVILAYFIRNILVCIILSMLIFVVTKNLFFT
ncbi:AzlD domain-containing protein [Neisseria sp. Ec49-e6-T10]|uniref:AzlD domain-containing protein n=1 Tax=Neisseria sp. Ec49-e6-T10 TaxID=3140744 RepID=UPI003EBC479D